MTEKKGLKEYLKKFWFIIWKDDSLKGWIFSIIFLFLFIEFIFFPGLKLVTGTSLPLAVVESCSMYHQGNLLSDFNAWWTRHEDKYSSFFINKLDFESFPLRNGFNKGDILFIVKANPATLKQGDIIIFNAGQANPIIHRIISIEDTPNGRIFSTIGDNNNGQLEFEQNITENMLVGKAEFKIAPYLGWVKLVFYDWENPPGQRGFCTEN